MMHCRACCSHHLAMQWHMFRSNCPVWSMLQGMSMFDLIFGSTMPAPPPAAPAEPAAAALPASQPAPSYLVPTEAAGSTEAAPMEEDVGVSALPAGLPAAAGPSQAVAGQPAARGHGTEGGAEKKLSLRERMALLRKQ